MKKTISIMSTASAMHLSKHEVKNGPGSGTLTALENMDRLRQFKPEKEGCLLKSIKTCSCDANYREEKWQRQISSTEMRYYDCPTVSWNNAACKTNCDDHTFDSEPVSFTAARYDNAQYSFPAGFSITAESGSEYVFGDVSECSLAQGTTQLEGRIMGFQVKIGGNVDYWGVLLETGGKPSKAKRPIKYKKVKGPGAGAIKDGQAGTKDNYKKYGNGEKECVLKAIEICQCPANYRSNDSHKMINYSMFEFDNCKDVTWGNAMCSNGEEAECTIKSVTGKMKSFTGYKHMYGNYAFPTGFVLEDVQGKEIAFGTTDKSAVSHGPKKLKGNIVGFNVITGGNVDYWGLEMESIAKNTKTKVKTKKKEVVSEDLTGNGEDYRGEQTKTVSGRTCQAWTSQSPHKHQYTTSNKGLGDHNFCRNSGDSDKIWCYTIDDEKRWEYCEPLDAPIEEEEELEQDQEVEQGIEDITGKGENYRGEQTKTRSGRTCQAWTSQSPHQHEVTPENYPNKGLGGHNYCRNPDGESSIWCYTIDSGKRWDKCDPLNAIDQEEPEMAEQDRKPVCWVKYEKVKTHTLPVAGNTWVKRFGPVIVNQSGLHNWTKRSEKIRTYFKTHAQTQKVSMVFEGKFSGNIELSVSFAGKTKTMKFSKGDSINLGAWKIKTPGYQNLVLKGLKKGSLRTFGDLTNLKLTCIGEINYVPAGDKTFNYWARRSPAGILANKLPNGNGKDIDVKYWYSELWVPKGMDAPGAYFMSIGFSVGYMGMQVRHDGRWILFSVWSPFDTQDSTKIPEDQRVKMLRKGKDTNHNDFGGEGAGGASHLVFPWVAERTYGFLVKGVPSTEDKDHTVYTAWFKSEELGWTLIASWSRPGGAQYMDGMYQFNENFLTDYGDAVRECCYSRQWAYDTERKWHESTLAKTNSADKTRYDVDIRLGQDGKAFCIKQQGFIQSTYKNYADLTRKADEYPPDIDFDALP